MTAEFEKVQETLLRNRKSIAALHDAKVMTQQARQMYARETRRQRKEKEREQRVCMLSTNLAVFFFEMWDHVLKQCAGTLHRKCSFGLFF